MTIFMKFLKLKLIWAILGNNEDSTVPDWYKPNSKEWAREFLWFFIRNPFHNFTFRVIGFKDRKLDYTQIWNTKQSWNLVLPFFSKKFKSGREFYVGWRPDTRAFGAAWRKK